MTVLLLKTVKAVVLMAEKTVVVMVMLNVCVCVLVMAREGREGREGREQVRGSQNGISVKWGGMEG